MHVAEIDIKLDRLQRFVVRATITLDDEVFELATRQAKQRGVSLGKAVSDLVRRGLNAPAEAEEKNGVVMFKLPSGSREVTTEGVRRLESEG
jgi:hypothetical protein